MLLFHGLLQVYVSWSSPSCLLSWDISKAAMSEIHSALWAFHSHLWRIHSAGLIWKRALLSSPLPATLSVSRLVLLPQHIPAVHKDLSFYILSRRHTPRLRFKRLTVAMGTISTLSALLRSARSEAICPSSHASQSFYLPILPSSCSCSSSSSSSSSPIRRWKKNPILHSREAWLLLLLFFLSDSFTLSVWHQQSPLLLLSHPLYTAFMRLCVYTCFFLRLSEHWGGGLGENVHLLLISATQDQLSAESWDFPPKFPWGTQGASLMYRLSHTTKGKIRKPEVSYSCGESDLYVSSAGILIA